MYLLLYVTLKYSSAFAFWSWRRLSILDSVITSSSPTVSTLIFSRSFLILSSNSSSPCWFNQLTKEIQTKLTCSSKVSRINEMFLNLLNLLFDNSLQVATELSIAFIHLVVEGFNVVQNMKSIFLLLDVWFVWWRKWNFLASHINLDEEILFASRILVDWYNELMLMLIFCLFLRNIENVSLR